jgi:hypothetical protein
MRAVTASTLTSVHVEWKARPSEVKTESSRAIPGRRLLQVIQWNAVISTPTASQKFARHLEMEAQFRRESTRRDVMSAAEG